MKRLLFLLLSCIVFGRAINAAEPRENDYSLHDAVKAGDRDLVAALLGCSNINVNEQDEEGSTPLLIAAGKGYVEIARLLIKHAAHPNLADHNGSTPLHEAVRGGHVSIVRLLLEHDADPNVQNRWQKSPLHCAVSKRECNRNYNGKSIFCLLLMHGAKKDLIDYIGRTPLDHTTKIVKQLFSESEQMVKRMRAAQLTICSAMHQRLGKNSCLQPLGALPVKYIAQCLQPADFEVLTK